MGKHISLILKGSSTSRRLILQAHQLVPNWSSLSGRLSSHEPLSDQICRYQWIWLAIILSVLYEPYQHDANGWRLCAHQAPNRLTAFREFIDMGHVETLEDCLLWCSVGKAHFGSSSSYDGVRILVNGIYNAAFSQQWTCTAEYI